MTENRYESIESTHHNLNKREVGLNENKPNFLSTANYTKGITLIALVVTIIVLLILAGITITMVIGEDGIIKKAQDTVDKTELTQENTKNKLANLLNEISNTLISETPDPEPPATPTPTATPTSKPTPNADGPQVTVDGQTVTLTKENISKYLGKKVTNFKTSTGGTETITAGTTSTGTQNVTVSTTYRLYYVDFTNKYKDGAGTIYIKADCTGNDYTLPTSDTSSDSSSNVKIKTLNPELYKSGVTSPSASNDNMKEVTWLLNTNNWNTLKNGVNTTTQSKIKYIVGAPSVEMMMDSYNTKYDLLGQKEPDTGELDASPTGKRTRLFYKFTSGEQGYRVGPCDQLSNGYGFFTTEYSVKSDSKIDTMYYPGSGNWYWLGSPMYLESGYVIVVLSEGSFIAEETNEYSLALCPLVSLESSVRLTLED